MLLHELFEAVEHTYTADNVDQMIADLGKISGVSEVSKDGKNIEVQMKSGNSVCFIFRADTIEAVVPGYKDDIYVGDVGNTTKDISSFIKGFNTKAWFKEHDKR